MPFLRTVTSANDLGILEMPSVCAYTLLGQCMRTLRPFGFALFGTAAFARLCTTQQALQC